jgi:hypothetical protein
LGRKHIYLTHVQTAIYDSKVKLFLKQGISHQLGRDAVVRFECENSAIDVIINFFMKNIPITTANFGEFSNFCQYYTRSQMGKSTGYRPTLKPLLSGPSLCHSPFILLMRKLNTEPSIGASHQVSVHLAKQFQRRF